MKTDLEEINTDSPYYDFVERLLHGSFPSQERRPEAEQRAVTDREPRFHTLLIRVDDIPAGVLTYWDFGSFRYGEHFAIAGEQRNGGIGGKVFAQFIAMASTPVVLEVEPEGSNSMASRRIRFYRRLGLRLWNTPYLQPPYRKGGEPFPLSLMSTDGLEEQRDFNRVKKLIHHHVYLCDSL